MTKRSASFSPTPRQIVDGALVLICLAVAGAVVQLLQIPTDPENAIIFGLSPLRLAMLLGVLGYLGLNFLLAACVRERRLIQLVQWVEKPIAAKLGLLAFLLLLFFGWALAVPPDSHAFYVNNIQLSIIERLRPVVQLLTISGWIYLLLFGWLQQMAERAPAGSEARPLRLARLSLTASAGIGLVTVVLLTTRWGLTPQAAFWGEAGVFVLGYQFLIVLAISVALGLVMTRLGHQTPLYRWALLAILLGSWWIASQAWANTDLAHNFYFPKAETPNTLRFPYSDAAAYDTRAQLILAGDGFMAGAYSARPIYIAFLAVLHAITGGAYPKIIDLQVAVLALSLPVLILLGRRLRGAASGILLAGLMFVAELNLIQATPYLKVSHSRLLLTEFFLAIQIVFYLYITVGVLRHFQNGGNEWPAAFFFSAGLAGVLLLTRLHALPVVLVSALTFLIVAPKPEQFRQRVRRLLVYGGIVWVVVLPWMLRNYIVVGQFSIEPGRVGNVVQSRWQEPVDNSSGITANEAVHPLQKVANHFAHNIVLSVLALPLDYSYQDIDWHFENRFHFGVDWAGELNPGERDLLWLNLGLLALGLGSAVARNGALGLLPLAAFLAYHGGNALAGTSGWRYLRPVDWVIYLYFAMGVIQVIRLIFPVLDSRPSALINGQRFESRPWLGALIPLALVLAASFAPALIPRRFAAVDEQSAMSVLQQALQSASIDLDLTQTGGALLWGQTLYPAYVATGDEIRLQTSPADQPIHGRRYEFYLLNRVRQPIILRLSEYRGDIPNGKDAIAWVCVTNQGYYEAAVLLVYEETGPQLVLRDELPTGEFCAP